MTIKINRTVVVGLLACASLGLAGCGAWKKTKEKLTGSKESKGSGEQGEELPDLSGGQSNPLGLTAGLVTFKDCGEAESYIETKTIEEIDRQLLQELKWIDRYIENDDKSSGGGTGSSPGGQVPASAESAGSDGGGDMANDSAKEGPTDHSTTNNQVEGVEEADIVKNDGKVIYHVSKGKLRILKSWPAEALAEIAALPLEGRPFEMLLDEDKGRLVVLAHPKLVQAEKPEVGAPAADVAMPGWGGGPSWDSERLSVLVVDVKNPASPRVSQRYLLKGSYNSSRRLGASVRIVLQSYRRMPEGVQQWLDWNEMRRLKKGERVARYKEMMAKNRALIEGKDLAYWLETDEFARVDDAGAKAPALDLKNCESVHAPTTANQFGYTHVASLDLDAGAITDTLLLSYVSQIYASTSSLYLVTPFWWWNDEDRDGDVSFLHKFDITQPTVAAYMGSGAVEGMLLNQFSMDEHEGHLRVATTITKRVKAAETPEDGDGDIWSWATWTTTNRVSVLAQDAAALKVVGQTADLAPGERIYSARFEGPRGFVVTFRQVDPLYTLDLTNPAEPKVVGELKIPGYSSYIHMLDANHLLTVGREGEETGRIRGLKVAIYDVTDMANPTEKHKFVLGDGEDEGGVSSSYWSEAEWNHKAFTLFKARGLLAIPVTGYSYSSSYTDWWGRYQAKLLVFKVDAAAGVESLGAVDMTDVYGGKEREQGWWWGGARVRRSVFADDFVYAISDFGVRSARVDALTQPLATAAYACDDTCYNSWWWWD